jgi:hypothetical protein
MSKQNLPYLLLGLVLAGFGLAGCELQRPRDENDIAQSVPEIVTPAPAEGDFAPPQAVQPGNAIVRLQPAVQPVEVGDTATVEIRIANVVNLAGADVELRFDPAILQAQDANPAQEGIQIQPGDFLQPDFVVTNTADNQAGLIRYILTQVGNIPPANGEGRLATVTFVTINPGVSDLTFTIAKLASQTADPIPVTTETGQVVVEPESAAGPVIEPTVEPTAEEVQPTVEPTEEGALESEHAADVPEVTPTPTPATEPAAPLTTEPPTLLAKIPPGATFGFCYRVRPGEENIHFLAKKFDATPYAINLVNDLYPPNYIFTHQILFMPEEMGRGPNVYRIRAGDTLTSIAAECHLTAKMLIRRNELDPEIDPDAPLPEGEALKIPIPYFPPPSRFEYPIGPIPVVPLPPPCCARPPYRPGPPVHRR